MNERDLFNERNSLVPPAAEAEVLPSRVKLQANIGIERAIPLFFGIGVVVFMAIAVLSGGRPGNGVIQSKGGLWWIGVGIGCAFWLAAALIWVLADEYYILDRHSHRILLHKRFRFLGTDSPFLENNQIEIIGLDCFPARGKYGQKGWTYVPVLLTRDGREIRLSSLETGMECQKLPEFNQRVRQWAAALECKWMECPPKQEFQIQNYVRRKDMKD